MAKLENKIENKPTSKVKKMTLINVVAAMFTTVFLIDSIVPAAGAGASTIIWYLILGVAFYIPYGFVTAEFSSKIPDEGGVYSWVKKSLGIGAAKRTAWYYWVNVGIWAPSISVYIAQMIQFMWFGSGQNVDEMYNHPYVTMGIAIAFMWGSLAFSYFPIADNAKLYNSATILKIVIISFIFIGMFTQIGKGTQKNFINSENINSDFNKIGTAIMFLPALVYNILGVEAIAGEASRVKNSKKNLARGSLLTVLSLLIFYIITTIAIQYTTDINGIDLSATIQSLINSFGYSDMGSKILVNVLAIAFIYTMFIETMGWVSGGNAGIMESAKNKEVPEIFKWKNKRGMPFKSTIILGLIGTFELILFTTIAYLEDGTIGGILFWSLFATSSNILFLSYFMMFCAYIKMKWTGKLDEIKGFSIKKWIAIPMAIIASIILIITYVLLIWSPDYDVIQQTIPIIISVIFAMGAGEICFILANKKYRKNKKTIEKTI